MVDLMMLMAVSYVKLVDVVDAEVKLLDGDDLAVIKMQMSTIDVLALIVNVKCAQVQIKLLHQSN